MTEYPEMTADQQDQRRKERLEKQLKAMDRSSGYWCERDTDGIPYMHYPDGSHRYWPPDKDPTKLSADRPHGDSLEYAVCPMTGQIHNAADTSWWRAHYGTLADAAENAAEEYQLDQHDPDWRGKKGGVMASNPAVSKDVPEPQRSFLTYAVEAQHGMAHQLKWARMLLATGYLWRGMMSTQMDTVFQRAEVAGPLTHAEMLQYYEKHGRNARWTMAKKWFDTSGETTGSTTPEYIYGEDLENARQRADDRGETVQWAAITAEIDLRMTAKASLPRSVTAQVIDQVEEVYPGIRLDSVREKLGHTLRPGSPEWREAQYAPGGPLHVDITAIRGWNSAEATEWFRAQGKTSFSGPFEVQGQRVWLDFVMCEDGNERQAVGISPVVARYADAGHHHRPVSAPNAMADAIDNADWHGVELEARKLTGAH